MNSHISRSSVFSTPDDPKRGHRDAAVFTSRGFPRESEPVDFIDRGFESVYHFRTVQFLDQKGVSKDQVLDVVV